MTTEMRAKRSDEVRQERRRRDHSTLDASRSLKLAVPDDVAQKLAAEGRTPRWVNDNGSRMHDLTKLDDYDKVDGVEPRRVGTKDDGSPLMAYLCSKPAEFIAEDRRKADAPRRAAEQAMVKGDASNNPNPEAADFYAVNGNTIHTARHSP